jgi:hypothetical protein
VSHRHPLRTGAAALLTAGLVLGCTSAGTDPTDAPRGSVATRSAPTRDPSSEPSASGSSPTDPVHVESPPQAALTAEGGDPVVGQLGTYTWGDAGSDSPWLPGEPITVGAGEPLQVAFDPSLEPATWTALLAPPGAQGPDEAEPLADGSGLPTFPAPPAGRYTLALQITVEGEGTAHYAWLLDVR